MSWKLTAGLAAAALITAPGGALAEGELNLFNWGNYTSPELIEKFEAEHDVEVTITDYDSNSTALAKVQAGGHGFDMVVPSANYVKIFIEEGLALETRPDQMENFEHVAEQWRDPDWDPGRHYSVPWLWGSTGIVVDTEVWQGDINTSAVIFDPPEELVGRINVAPAMADVIGTALLYIGSEPCTSDKAALEEARDLLMAAKPKWLSMDYGLVEKMPRGDFAAALYWNGAAFRARLAKPSIQYGYPKEGFSLWMDNVIVLKDAENVENAKAFQNFIMAPENAAMNSEFARYANGIEGSEAFMPDDMQTAPEIVIPDAFKDAGVFFPSCPQEVNDIYTAIWTELTK